MFRGYFSKLLALLKQGMLHSLL